MSLFFTILKHGTNVALPVVLECDVGAALELDNDRIGELEPLDAIAHVLQELQLLQLAPEGRMRQYAARRRPLLRLLGNHVLYQTALIDQI